MPFACRTRRRVLLASLASLLGCQGVTGNAADRVAFGLREGASRLSLSRNTNDSITVRVPARSWPSGCPGNYKLQLLADSAKASGIVVSCLPKGTTYTSLYAKRFVHTPVALEAELLAGQPVDIVLQKRDKDLFISGFTHP